MILGSGECAKLPTLKNTKSLPRLVSATMASSFAIAAASITEAMAKFNFLLTLGTLMGFLWTRNHPHENSNNDSGCTKIRVFLYATSFCYFFFSALAAEATRLLVLSVKIGRWHVILRLSVICLAGCSAIGFGFLTSAVVVEAQMLRTHIVACQNSFSFYLGVFNELPFLILPPLGIFAYLLVIFLHALVVWVDILNQSWDN